MADVSANQKEAGRLAHIEPPRFYPDRTLQPLPKNQLLFRRRRLLRQLHIDNAPFGFGVPLDVPLCGRE
jgi:hypothetical protein